MNSIIGFARFGAKPCRIGEWIALEGSAFSASTERVGVNMRREAVKTKRRNPDRDSGAKCEAKTLELVAYGVLSVTSSRSHVVSWVALLTPTKSICTFWPMYGVMSTDSRTYPAEALRFE